MNNYKITYMKKNGVLYSKRVKAETMLDALHDMGDLVVFQVCQVNEVGAIIGENHDYQR